MPFIAIFPLKGKKKNKQTSPKELNKTDNLTCVCHYSLSVIQFKTKLGFTRIQTIPNIPHLTTCLYLK